MLSRSDCRVFDQHGRGHVPEDEMAVAVTPVQMAAGNFRTDDEHALRTARPNVIGCGLYPESGRGAGDVHVEPEAVDPQRLLYFDRHGRIGPLHIRGRAQHGIDIRSIATCAFKRLTTSCHPDLGHLREFVIAAHFQAGLHDRRVENRLFRQDVARLDPAGLLDEFDRTGMQRFDLADSDCVGVLRVEPLDEGVEACDQFFVADALLGRKQAGSGNDGATGHRCLLCHGARD